MPNMIRKANHRLVAYNIMINFAATLILSFLQPTLAQSQQKSFASAALASQALYEAVRDRNDQLVQEILGEPELASSANVEQDKLERERFAEKYQQMHRLVREKDGSVVLYIGAENWPFPIPLVATGGSWHFDSDAGSNEILARQIGENETTAIKVCQAIAKIDNPSTNDAGANDAVVAFARKLVQSEDANSPAAELFYGYNFQASKGGSGQTVVVTYPAEYRRSGVMTFVLSGGTVYEKDLGSRTATAAQQIQGKPRRKWYRVQYPAN